MAEIVQLSYDSPEKLKKTADWTGRLRRTVELFNRCLESCKDSEINEARIAIVEAFGKPANCCNL